MKKNNKLFIASIALLCLVPFILSFIFYTQLPEQIAIHWSSNGTIDGYGTKNFVTFGLPAIMSLISIVLCIIINRYLKVSNKSQGNLKIFVSYLVPIIFIILQSILILNTVNVQLNLYLCVSLVLGITLMVLGNYLPKIRTNCAFGIRTSWTLTSESNWDNTHKFASYVWVIIGFIIVISSFLGSNWLFLSIIFLLALIIPVIYSFYLHIKENK